MSLTNAYEKLPLIEWILKRCISLDVVQAAGVGYSKSLNAILYPRCDYDGKQVGWKVRRLDSGRQFNHPRGIPLRDTTPFIAQWGEGKTVIFCEGETDSLCLASHTKRYRDARIYAIPGASSFSNHWVGLFKDTDEIYLIPDNDRAGMELAQKVCGLLPRTKVVTLDEGEDLSDAVSSRGIDDLEERISNAEPIRVRTKPRRDSDDYVGDCNYDPSNLVDLVRQHTRLYRRGDELAGLCPLHEERTPSFMVNPKKGLFHCHGCGKGGDIIAYLREKNGFSFKEAVRFVENSRR